MNSANGSANPRASAAGMNNANSSRSKDDKDLESAQKAPRSRLSFAIETFKPTWFAVCMNSGILSILLHNLPYQFHGAGVLSTILFVIDLVLFIVFVSVQIARFCLFPRSALRQTVDDPEETCFWGCAPIALLTITAQVGITVSNASWGGHAFTLVAYVLWWFNMAYMLLTAWVVYYTLARNKMIDDFDIPTAAFLPAVGTATSAVVGALLVNYAHDIGYRLSVPVVIVGYMLTGFGLFLALCVYAVFLYRLVTKGLPPPAKLPSLMLLVGPLGQCASALQLLGTGARSVFGGYDKGTFLTSESSMSVDATSVVLALLFLGFDIFWLVFVVYAILEQAFQRQLSFSMGWWSTIFPVATLNISLIELGIELDSPTFRILATAFFLILLIDYLLCWAFTLYHIWLGRILDGRDDEQKRK